MNGLGTRASQEQEQLWNKNKKSSETETVYEQELFRNRNGFGRGTV